MSHHEFDNPPGYRTMGHPTRSGGITENLRDELRFCEAAEARSDEMYPNKSEIRQCLKNRTKKKLLGLLNCSSIEEAYKRLHGFSSEAVESSYWESDDGWGYDQYRIHFHFDLATRLDSIEALGDFTGIASIRIELLSKVGYFGYTELDGGDEVRKAAIDVLERLAKRGSKPAYQALSRLYEAARKSQGNTKLTWDLPAGPALRRVDKHLSERSRARRKK